MATTGAVVVTPEKKLVSTTTFLLNFLVFGEKMLEIKARKMVASSD